MAPESSPERAFKSELPNDAVFHTPSGDKTVFLSPTKALPIHNLSPSISPTKRGNVTLEVTNPVLSPVRTPNARADLPLPLKRPLGELDQSARKRAYRTTKYARLMEDEQDEEAQNDPLEVQNRRLAEEIIRDSKASELDYEDSGEEYIQQPGNDSAQEAEDSAYVRKTRSGRELKRITLEVDPDAPPPVRRPRGRPRGTKKTTNKPPQQPTTPKRKVGRPRTRPSPPSEKRRVGRPSKAEVVIGNVKSIFQMDDELYLNSTPKKKPVRKPGIKAVSSVNFDNTGSSTYSSVPVISGVSTPNTVPGNFSEQSDDVLRAFVPMPIPQVNEEGDIADEEYAKRYFPDVSLDSIAKGKLLDDRAFFLDGSEGYFEQHGGRVKSSGSSLRQHAPSLEYDEFIPFVQLSRLIQAPERFSLNQIHKSLYRQLCFELSQGFNVNIYGVGSKIRYLTEFCENYLVEWYEETMQVDDEYPYIMVVNGYNPATRLKSVLQDIMAALISPEEKKSEGIRFPKHVSEIVPFLVQYLERNRSTEVPIRPKVVLAINNIDGEALRDEKTQNYISQVCSLPEVWLVSSTDNINVTLLWDLFRMRNYNFLWHNVATYEPYSVEISFKDVLSMGKSKKFVGNKGARYVLTSLTSNARKLYRILLEMQLDVLKASSGTGKNRSGLRANLKLGLTFKSFYTACLEQFVTSNEISFRTILGEFVEHKMCTLGKDDAGTEIVFVPFTFHEVELLLQEEVGGAAPGEK